MNFGVSSKLYMSNACCELAFFSSGRSFFAIPSKLKVAWRAMLSNSRLGLMMAQ